ncbi:MAG: glycosyltransferase family 39 protein [Cyanobacteria bacterium P01_A01_bin.114]
MLPKFLNHERLDAGLLAIASLILYLWRLGQLPLRDWDEGTIAMVAREMLRSGQWLHPTLYGGPYLNKPPLVEWLMASTFAMAGISEWTARFLPALISAIAVPTLYWVGRELFQNRRAAAFSALIYLCLLPVVRHGRLAMRDGIAVTLFLILLLAVLKARQDRRWALLAGVALGGLILTKGILALLLAGIVGIFLLVNRQWALLGSLYAWGGIILGSLPALAWYGAQLQHYGSLFWQAHFLSQSFDRVWSTIENNQGPPWYYLLELLKYSWPWLLLWPGGLWLAWQHRRHAWGQLIWVGSALYLGTISIMGTKLPWYVIPLYPFMALAIGAQLADLWQRNRVPRWLGWVLAVLAIVMLGGGSYIGWAEGESGLIAIAVALSVTLSWTAVAVFRCDRAFAIPLIAGFYLTLLIFVNSDLWVWELNEAYPVKPVAEMVRSQTPEGAEIYTTFAYSRPSLDFYSARRVIAVKPQHLDDYWQPNTYFLLERLEELPPFRNLGTAEGLALISPE